MLYMAGRPADALKDFETVLEMFPTDSRAWSDLGTLHFHLNDPRAADDYTKAIVADPTNYRALTNRSTILVTAGRLEDAKKDLETALRLNPHHLAAQHNLAVTVYKLGDRPDSLRRLTEILVHSPDMLRARLTRGMMFFEGAQWKEALEDFERAVAINPSSEPSLRSQMEACRKRLGR
jgi:tetratricopeptide (TPR) repeat protein